MGGIVPSGYYDKGKAAWISSDNGLIIEVLSIENGTAVVDINGNGEPADAQALADLGMDNEELQKLAQLYTAGQSLWRVPVTHCTPWDFNWPVGPPEDAVEPKLPEPKIDETMDEPSIECGSVIEIQNQVLGEATQVSGTPFSLHYSSDRVNGRRANYTLGIPLAEETYSPSLKRIDLEIRIAGKVYFNSYTPEPKLSALFTWDGRDAYGRELQGRQLAEVSIGYVYDGQFQEPAGFDASFGNFSGIPLRNNLARQEVVLYQNSTHFLGSFVSAKLRLGGWSLNSAHSYNLPETAIYLGNGTKRSATGIMSTLICVAGIGIGGYAGDGGPAVGAMIDKPNGIAVDAENNIYFSDMENSVIRRIDNNGTITTIAGGGHTFSVVDVQPALDARFNNTSAVCVGPDGSIYVADYGNLVRKIDSDGMITLIAGTGECGFSGDGGPATEAQLAAPRGLSVSEDGSIYVADNWNCRIRKISNNGIISTIAGTGDFGYRGDGLPATQAKLGYPTDVALGPDGSIFIADCYNNRIRKISPDGIISTFAGTGDYGYSGDGGLATKAKLQNPCGIDVDPLGNVYIVDNMDCRVRKVGTDGIITTIGGNGNSDYGINATHPMDAKLMWPQAVAYGSDNNIHIADTYGNRLAMITPSIPRSSVDDILIPSEDGSQIFHFNPHGKHLRTLDALTGKAIYTFNYNDSGLLSSITDIDSNVTTIERDAQGNPTAIIAPFGQRTELTLDSDGYLSSITNPAGETTSCTYHEGGLLASFTNPEGNTSTFTYDDMGRLIKDENAAGGYTALERTETDLGFEIKKTIKAENDKVYETVYLTENLPAGGMRQVTYNCCGGGTVETIIGTDGTTRTTSPDGTVTETVEGPDPRFGMQAPIIKRKTITTPSGLVYEMTSSRAAVLEDDIDPLSIQTLIDSVNVNGDTYITTYDAQSKTITSTSPENRQSVSVMDDKGKVIQSEIPGQVPSVYDYDERGRLTTVTQGTGALARQSTITYNTEGFMESMTDAAGRSVSFSYDAAGRVLTETHPDGRLVSYTYDQNGNLTTLTPPGSPEHGFGYTNVEMLETYSPPNVGAGSNFTRYSYNLNKQLVNLSRPDGQMLDFLYDDIGRLTEVYLPTGQVSYIYSDTSNALRSIVSPDGTLSYNYDGALVTGVEWSGLVNGSVGINFNSAFQITSQSINGQAEIAFGYDSDGLLESIGQMLLSRNPQDGKLTGTALENVEDSYSYNEFGNQISYTALAGGSQLYEATHTGIDKLGRITSRTETVEGQTTSYSYNYDVAGQLTEVYRNGALYSRYGYDENGNRTDYFGPAGTITASFDDQDRMLTYGDATYQYTANGELQSKTDNSGTTQYDYDVLGNLKTVTLPDGTLIEYLADGRNRRIGVKLNGTLDKGFLYQDQLNPVAELDGAGNVVSQFVYGTKMNVPDYMVKGGVVYRIISDHLGSVRLVVNAHTGEIAQRMDYDEFGNVLLDNNPGFQPFGFAGGIYDHRTGLVRFGARDYDAQTGRWTCKDPIRFEGEDGNLYRYCNNSPFMYYDPSGLLGDELMLAGTLITGVGFALNPVSPLLIAVGGVTLIAGTGIRLWEAYNIEGQKAKNAYQNAIDKAYEKYPDEFLDEEFRKNRDKRHNRNKCND